MSFLPYRRPSRRRPFRFALGWFCLVLLVGGCREERPPPRPTKTVPADDGSLSFARAPDDPPDDAPDDPGARPFAESDGLRAQVALDRLGFSPGVIDGKEGMTLRLALRGFQQARDLPETGTLDERTRRALLGDRPASATRRVTIPAAFARGPFYPALPKDEAGMARFDHLGYRSMTEALAERFHTTPDALVAMNGPRTPLGAGRVIRVPDIPDVDPARLAKEDARGWNATLQKLGVSPVQPRAARIVIDKSQGSLSAFDAEGKLIAQFPVTTGSAHDPLPIGTWKILGQSRNPDFQYNPRLFWDADPRDKATRLPPGPNGPVGVVWLDLSKAHYGIHGTPEPRNIGRTESHGCVRMTNWDVARLAEMVDAKTEVVTRR